MSTISMLLLAGCSHVDDGADNSSAASSSESTTATIPVPPAQVVVTSPGAEGRQRLTLATDTSSDQQVRLTTSSTVAQQIDDQTPQDFSTPEVSLGLTAGSSPSAGTTGPNTAAPNTAAPETAAVHLTLGAIDSPDERLREAMEASTGSTAGLTRTPSGLISELKIAPADNADNAARSAVEQALLQMVYTATPLPDAEVGVGATWTATQTVRSQIELTQLTSATLSKRDGNIVTLDVQITQTPVNPVWTLPDNDGDLHIDTYQMAGGGTVTIDLDQVLPVSGTIQYGGGQVYSDPSGGITIRQDITNRVTWSS